MSDFRRRLMSKKIESELPSEYQQVNYIEFNGNEYILLDTVLLKKNVTYKTECSISFTSFTPNINTFYLNGFTSGFAFGLIYNKLTDGFGYNTLPDTLACIDQIYDFSVFFDGIGQYTYVDGALYHERAQGSVYTSNDERYPIGCSYSSKNPSYFCKQRIHKRYRLYINDSLIFDGIPCYNKSNKESGLYDIISKRFFGNMSANGNITYGNEV